MTGSRDIQNGRILSGQTSYMSGVQIPVVRMLTTSPHYAAQLHEQITGQIADDIFNNSQKWFESQDMEIQIIQS